MILRREPKGYWALGVSYTSGFGRTVVVSLLRWKIQWHWRDREMDAILRQVAEGDRPPAAVPADTEGQT